MGLEVRRKPRTSAGGRRWSWSTRLADALRGGETNSMVAEDGEHGRGRRRARSGETASTVGEDGEHGQGVGRDEEERLEMTVADVLT